ncbi:MAG: IS66 family insertion sequence element accessory protein TnpB [Succinivibrio sp.]|nr:IS66 family insertion sequence element accessory protein TnpB [Succinivibrio sp.]
MALLSSTGRIFLVLEPVSGRLGIPRLLARLASNSFQFRWNGEDEITVIVTNRRRSILKILHIDATGCDLTTRILNHGTFKVLFSEKCIPRNLTRGDLERLFIDGTLTGEYQNKLSEELLSQRQNQH